MIGRARVTLKVPSGMVKLVAVSPDGQVLATIAADGSVRLWSAGVHAWPRPPETDRDVPGDANTLSLSNNLAWARRHAPISACGICLVPLPGAIDRPARALEGLYWNTLGVAYCRAGDWNAAHAALERSMQLRSGGDSHDWFFLAMACWNRGDRKQALTWLERAGAGWTRTGHTTTSSSAFVPRPLP